MERMKALCFGRAFVHKLINPTQFCRIMPNRMVVHTHILTTFLLLLTASTCPGLPYFACSVIALTISAAATYPENRGKTGRTNANQEDFKI